MLSLRGLDIIPVLEAIGQCGSVLGSHLYPTTDKPKYMYVSRLVASRTGFHAVFCSAFIAKDLLVSKTDTACNIDDD
jgi:hypothetical protein